MADIRRRIRRFRNRIAGLPIPRVCQDRTNPLEVMSELEVFNRYRFRPHSIIQLVDRAYQSMVRPTSRSNLLPPLLSVLVTLQFLTTGTHYIVVGAVHGISPSSVCLAVKGVIKVFAKIGSRTIGFRSDVAACKAEFYRIAAFPNVIGVVNGTHIRVQAPREYEGDYVNRKGNHSINVQVQVRTRVVIEQSFGILKRRFPCLPYGLRMEPDFCCTIILACVFLHTFGLSNGDTLDPNDDFNDDQPEVQLNFEGTRNGLLCRDILAEQYF